jgi:hypothetical protein
MRAHQNKYVSVILGTEEISSIMFENSNFEPAFSPPLVASLMSSLSFAAG